MSDTDGDTGTGAAAGDLARRNIALLRRYLETINTGNLAALPEILHPEISFELPFVAGDTPKVTRGVDAVLAYLQGLPSIATSMRLLDIEVHAFLDDANELVAEYRSEMTLTNGRPYRNTYVTRATVRDGRLAVFREHFDPTAFVEAMGGSVTLPGA
jgi:uncharacterized protein